MNLRPTSLFSWTRLSKLLAIAMLIFATGYNLWLYRYEPTAKIDPNDNPFQFALVYRTNEVWDYAIQTCPKNPLFLVCFAGFLVDHTVPNWAQGYSLPFYYSHVPQISIVASYRLLDKVGLLTPLVKPFNDLTSIDDQSYQTELFAFYHLVIYLLLCLFPIVVFWSLRVIKTPWLVSGLGALIALQTSTDGLYGLDPSSFLWRGYGLSSQLFAMIFMPLAIAYSLRYFHDLKELQSPNLQFNRQYFRLLGKLIRDHRAFFPAVIFLALSIAGHLGLGLITIISTGVLAISPALIGFLEKQSWQTIFLSLFNSLTRLALLAGTALLFVSYWIIPVFMYDQYHNISFWDPVWKFNSYGWKEVITQFLNGNLFDFGRFPVVSILILIGCFAVLRYYLVPAKKSLSQTSATLYPLAFLFIFWFVMFFGRTTWGGLIDLIPGMKEFHQSRFIVGIHLAGFFLAPIGFWWLSERIYQLLQTTVVFLRQSIDLLRDDVSDAVVATKEHPLSSYGLLLVMLMLALGISLTAYPQTYRYAKHNDVLIKQGNDNFLRQNPDVEKLITYLKSQPAGRTFVGRGGSWGKQLAIAETTYFLHLSTYGIPVILWLPETWSPNSDIEQFFIEDWPEHYDLMNIRHIVTPPGIEPKPFWEKIDETPSWVLYKTSANSFFTTGSLAAVVYSDKQNFVNLIRLWLQSDNVKKGIFPQLTFDKKESVGQTLPNFQMIDESTYTIRGDREYSLFGSQPSYEAPASNLKLIGPETVIDGMNYQTTIEVGPNCQQCLVVLKYTSHPHWKAFLNGQPTRTITAFPFYTGVPVSNEGTYKLELRYQPSALKLVLLVVGFLSFIALTTITVYTKLRMSPLDKLPPNPETSTI